MKRLSKNSVIDIKNRPFSVSAAIDASKQGATQGVIVAQGGRLADETTDIGNDYGMPVSPDYEGASKFNGRIEIVQIDVGNDDHSHLIDPQEVARIATARQ